jgi:hypothetical protein
MNASAQDPANFTVGSAVIAIPPSVLRQAAAGNDVVALVVQQLPDNFAQQLQTQGRSSLTFASALLNLNFYTSDGKSLKTNFVEPIELTLPGALPNATCVFWDEDRQIWSSKGVKSVPISTSMTCFTDHFTVFAAVLGYLEDFAQAIRCSNAAAMFSSTGAAAITAPMCAKIWRIEVISVVNDSDRHQVTELAFFDSAGSLIEAGIEPSFYIAESDPEMSPTQITPTCLLNDGNQSDSTPCVGENQADGGYYQYDMQQCEFPSYLAYANSDSNGLSPAALQVSFKATTGEVVSCDVINANTTTAKGIIKASLKCPVLPLWAGRGPAIALWVTLVICLLSVLGSIACDYRRSAGWEWKRQVLSRGLSRSMSSISNSLSPTDFGAETRQEHQEQKHSEESEQAEPAKQSLSSYLCRVLLFSYLACLCSSVFALLQANIATFIHLLFVVFLRPLGDWIDLFTGLLDGSCSGSYFVDTCVANIRCHSFRIDSDTLGVMEAVQEGTVDSNHTIAPLHHSAKTLATQVGIADASDEAFLQVNVAWRFVLLFQAYHPFAPLTYYNLFLSHTQRVAMLICDIMGGVAVSAVFYNASGSAMSIDADPTCIPRTDEGTKFVQDFAVGFVSSTVAFVVTSIITALLSLDVERLTKAQDHKVRLELQVWWVKNILFWIFLLSYFLISLWIVIVFIASVTPADGTTLLVSAGFSVLKAFLLMPLMMALFVGTMTSIVLTWRSIRSKPRDSKSDELETERTSIAIEGDVPDVVSIGFEDESNSCLDFDWCLEYCGSLHPPNSTLVDVDVDTNEVVFSSHQLNPQDDSLARPEEFDADKFLEDFEHNLENLILTSNTGKEVVSFC